MQNDLSRVDEQPLSAHGDLPRQPTVRVSATAPERKNDARKLFQVHNHVNVFRASDAPDGPVSREEQIAGVRRFIAWHQRQVQIGKALLTAMEDREPVAGIRVCAERES